MSLENYISDGEKNELKEIMQRQIADTQNVIKKKFEKACKNRMKHEQDVDQALKPLIAAVPVKIKRDLSSKTIVVPTQNPMKHVKNHANNDVNPNELCDKLRMLLASHLSGNAQTNEINSIIAKLKELKIIV